MDSISVSASKLFKERLSEVTYELSRLLKEIEDLPGALKFYKQALETDVMIRDAAVDCLFGVRKTSSSKGIEKLDEAAQETVRIRRDMWKMTATEKVTGVEEKVDGLVRRYADSSFLESIDVVLKAHESAGHLSDGQATTLYRKAAENADSVSSSLDRVKKKAETSFVTQVALPLGTASVTIAAAVATSVFGTIRNIALVVILAALIVYVAYSVMGGSSNRLFWYTAVFMLAVLMAVSFINERDPWGLLYSTVTSMSIGFTGGFLTGYVRSWLARRRESRTGPGRTD